MLSMFWARNKRIVDDLIFRATSQELAKQLVAHGVCSRDEASVAVRLSEKQPERLAALRSQLRARMLPPLPPVLAAQRVPIVAAGGFDAACKME